MAVDSQIAPMVLGRAPIRPDSLSPGRLRSALNQEATGTPLVRPGCHWVGRDRSVPQPNPVDRDPRLRIAVRGTSAFLTVVPLVREHG